MQPEQTALTFDGNAVARVRSSWPLLPAGLIRMLFSRPSGSGPAPLYGILMTSNRLKKAVRAGLIVAFCWRGI
jgi:hypothetical protein